MIKEMMWWLINENSKIAYSGRWRIVNVLKARLSSISFKMINSFHSFALIASISCKQKRAKLIEKITSKIDDKIAHLFHIILLKLKHSEIVDTNETRVNISISDSYCKIFNHHQMKKAKLPLYQGNLAFSFTTISTSIESLPPHDSYEGLYRATVFHAKTHNTLLLLII